MFLRSLRILKLGGIDLDERNLNEPGDGRRRKRLLPLEQCLRHALAMSQWGIEASRSPTRFESFEVVGCQLRSQGGLSNPEGVGWRL